MTREQQNRLQEIYWIAKGILAVYDTVDDLMARRYLDQVIAESIRLYQLAYFQCMERVDAAVMEHKRGEK